MKTEEFDGNLWYPGVSKYLKGINSEYLKGTPKIFKTCLKDPHYALEIYHINILHKSSERR